MVTFIACLDGDQHAYKSLPLLRNEVLAFLQTKLEDVTGKLIKLSDIDKEVLKNFEDHKIKCGNIIEEVTKIRNKQVG